MAFFLASSPPPKTPALDILLRQTLDNIRHPDRN